MKLPWRKTPAPTYPCGSCGELLSTPTDRHLIGSAHKQNSTFDKWCDGTETPRA